MKQVSVFLLFLSLAFITKAQIILDRADFGDIGDTVYLYTPNIPIDTVSPGAAGANMTWDFSFITTDTIADTLRFIDTTGISQVSQLPGTNLVIDNGFTLQFFEVDQNAVYVKGITLDFDTLLGNQILRLNPKMPQFQFPMIFGVSLSGTYTTNPIQFAVQDTLTVAGFTSYVDSLRIIPTLDKADDINGWGTLILPDQKSYDALRFESDLTFSFSIEALIPNPLPFPPPWLWFPLPSGAFPPVENKTVYYLGEDFDYPLMEMALDSNGVISDMSFQMDTSFVDTSGTSISGDLIDFKVYPIPFDNHLLILSQSNNSRYEIIDMLGRKRIEGIIRNKKELINTEYLERGSYFLKILDNKSNSISTNRIIKE